MSAQTPEAMGAYIQREGVDGCGFTRFLNISVVYCWDGVCELALTVRPDLCQSFGTLHGAVLAGLADIACGFAAFSRCGPAVTAELTAQFKLPVQAGETVHVKAAVENVEGRAVMVAATFRSGTDRNSVVLSAVARLVLLPTR